MKHVLLVAGETSGDRHGAALARELKNIVPGWELIGFGGPQMAAAGVDLKTDLTKHAVVGVVEVIQHLGQLKKLFKQICTFLDNNRPDAIILIDYPGFNLRLAKEAKRRGIRVIYYVSPQIWAWGSGRIRQIRKTVDLMIVFFSFEEELYRKVGVKVLWAGHPLLDKPQPDIPRAQALQQHKLPVESRLIALLPGSREAEIRTLAPILQKTFQVIATHIPNLHGVFFQAPGIPVSAYGLAPNSPIRIIPWDAAALGHCEMGLVASGTATLECALLDLPIVIAYQTHPITWWLGKLLVRLPYIGLVNVVAGKKLVPECLQREALPERIAESAYPILISQEKRASILAGYREIRKKLGSPGASRRAAEAVVSLLR